MSNFLPFTFRGLSAGAIVLAASFLTAQSSQAAYIVPSAPITAGGAAVAPPLTSAAPGTLLATLNSPFSFTTTAGTTSGNVLSAVFQNPSGTLDFYYQVINNGSSKTDLSRESNTNFFGFAPQVAFRLDGGSLGAGFTNGTPGIIPLTADLDSSGTTVGFSYVPTPAGTKIPKGTTSAVMVISTTATMFNAGNSEVLDGGSATVAAFQPNAVPEPASLVLFGAGLLALGGIRRFARK